MCSIYNLVGNLRSTKQNKKISFTKKIFRYDITLIKEYITNETTYLEEHITGAGLTMTWSVFLTL